MKSEGKDEKEEDKKISLNEKVVKALEEDIESLLSKLKGCMDGNDFSNYKMLINNLKDTVNLKQSLDWKLMYSEYSVPVDSEHFQKQVSVWEQDGDGNIRNHKVWNVEESKGSFINGKIDMLAEEIRK